jgi:glycerol uptake facilitator-like aquaporin
VPAAASGLVIGGSLFLGIHFAAHTSNGVLNPAVALGIGSFSLAYIWGPIAGAIVGALLYRLLSSKAGAE